MWQTTLCKSLAQVGMYLIVDTLKDIFQMTKCTLKFETKYPMGIKPFNTILFIYLYKVKQVSPHIALKSIGNYFHGPIRTLPSA